ncbi:hypothetical protein JCM10450v2_005695, partial [Rhodotorula kratochvilovae]
ITAVDDATSTYTFNLPSYIKIHRRLHASKIRAWYPNDDMRLPSRAFASPPPAIGATDDPNAEWEVEKIVGDKTYKVRWLGWAARWDDWVDAEELKVNAAGLVDDYETAKAAHRAPQPASQRNKAPSAPHKSARGTRARTTPAFVGTVKAECGG